MESDQNKDLVKNHDDCIKCGAPTSNQFVEEIGRTCSSCIGKMVGMHCFEDYRQGINILVGRSLDLAKKIYPDKKS